jgi:pheromone shutdown protein TraB
MIRIYGTSHVSRDSLEVIDEAFEEDPDIVALELDPKRLESLMFEGQSSPRESVFIRLMQRFQEYLGNKTGLMPGEEMLYAYNSAAERNLDVALIDQDIRITVRNLKNVRRKEKVKAFLSVLGGFLIPFGDKLDISEIPEEERISEMVSELEESFPEIYSVFMTDRNQVMAERLKALQDDNPEADIAVFLGAAHKNPVRELLERDGYEIGSESILEEK